jgi:hypothetical protein
MGTLAYMAPEQSEGREAGEQADVYSLALVLYEALCGFNPVRGATPAQTARRIGRPIRSLARERRDLSRALTQMIDRCLHRSPAARGTLEELGEVLEQALAESSPAPGAGTILGGASRRERPILDAGLDATWEQPQALVTPAFARPPLAARTPRHGRPPASAAAAAVAWHEDTPPPRGQPSESPAVAQAIVRAESWGLPRIVWLAGALALSLWQAAVGRPGVGLLALAALAPIVLLPVGRRAQGGSGGWLLCALAPLLGVVGLAGAFPAIAGQARRWRMRAAFAAVGYWWLTLAEPLLGHRLWLGVAANTPPREVWEGSLNATAVHVIAPQLSLGVLLGAASWAAGAVLLALIVRGRSAGLDVVAVSVWSAALAVVTPLLASGAQGHAMQVNPRGAAVGAVLGAALAVAARALRGPV